MRKVILYVVSVWVVATTHIIIAILCPRPGKKRTPPNA